MGSEMCIRDRPGNRVGALMSSATNTLTEAEQAEVDSLNRQVEIFNLKNEKDLLEKPRRKVSTPQVASTKQVEEDTIAELKASIESLKHQLEERQVIVQDDTSLSTPVVASLAGLGGVSLASLIGLAFTRRGVVS